MAGWCNQRGEPEADLKAMVWIWSKKKWPLLLFYQGKRDYGKAIYLTDKVINRRELLL
jgi:hypothetical protein